MKKLIMMIGIALCLVSCSNNKEAMSSPLDYIETVQSTDLSSETGGLESLDASRQTIIQQRGEPQQSGSTKAGETILEYSDYAYTIVNDRVAAYSLKPGKKTYKQVEIGDAEEHIAESYGQDFYEREQQGFSIKGYVDKENQRVIEFATDQKTVKMIIVSDLSIFN